MVEVNEIHEYFIKTLIMLSNPQTKTIALEN